MIQTSYCATPNAWYKRKRFLHFDLALKKNEAVKYVLNNKNILKHNFAPLIHYAQLTKKFKFDKKTNKLTIVKKPRNIFYASHIDGYIYSYYNFLLAQKYEEYLRENGLSDVVSAYRPVKKGGENFSNIHFAREANAFVTNSGGCKILCLDITKFFDNLSVDVLKNNWGRIWSSNNTEILEDDHYKVFKSLKNFHFVEEKDLTRIFNKNPRKRKNAERGVKQVEKNEINLSLHERICSFEKLREINNASETEKLIRNKSKLKIKGIPQGTAISGMLANISMIDFDFIVKKTMDKLGAFYRRYSDDIFIAFPSEINFEKIEEFIRSMLKKCSNGNLDFNSNKTNRCVYAERENGEGFCHNVEGKLSSFQYLGFEFNGKRCHVRSSSMSKNRAKIVRIIKKNKKGRTGKSKLVNINTRNVYKAQSFRKITPSDQVERKGFVSYGKRSEKIHNSPKIKKQIKKNDKFIKKKIDVERKPKHRKKERST